MDQRKQIIATESAPTAIGPYSQAVRAGDFVFVSGQLPMDPATMELIDGDIGAQTERAMENLRAVLKAAGADFDNVVRTTVYLADMNDFAAMNAMYATFFREPFPARSTIQAARLPRDARIEIDAIALAADE